VSHETEELQGDVVLLRARLNEARSELALRRSEARDLRVRLNRAEEVVEENEEWRQALLVLLEDILGPGPYRSDLFMIEKARTQLKRLRMTPDEVTRTLGYLERLVADYVALVGLVLNDPDVPVTYQSFNEAKAALEKLRKERDESKEHGL